VGKHDGRGYQWVEDMPPEMVAIPQAPPPPAMGPRLRALHAVEPTNDKKVDEADEKSDEKPAEVARVDEPRDAERSKTTEAEAPEEKPAEKADDKPAEKVDDKPIDEEDEGGRPGGKKKRALPSYLRVIK
jgi:hypothetical protein